MRALTFVIAPGLAGFAMFEIFHQAAQRVDPAAVPPARLAPVFEAVAPVVQEFVGYEIPLLSAAEAAEEQGEAPDLVLAPRLDLQNGSLPWEDRVKAITHSTTLDEAAKGRELLRNLMSLPEEGLEFVTQQAVDHLPDKDYNTAALGLLINPQTHGRVLAVLFADLLERPDEITLPALLSIARNPSHPFASQARDNLGLLVGKDFGNDWNQWDGEVRRLLKSP